MHIEQLFLEGLGHLSYVITDETSGTATVIDPRRDVEPYLEVAKPAGGTFPISWKPTCITTTSVAPANWRHGAVQESLLRLMRISLTTISPCRMAILFRWVP